MTESTQKLKPCPFCGQPAAAKMSDGWHAAGCTTYMAPGVLCYGQSIALQYKTESEAIAAWNNRAPTEAAVPEGCPTNEDTRDAERYRWLRKRHWNESNLFVVACHHSDVRLGTDCPSDERLDETIDAAIAKGEAK